VNEGGKGGGDGGSGYLFNSSSIIKSGYSLSTNYCMINTSLLIGNQEIALPDGTTSIRN
jgi:hypothetical protein